jgi:SAM-dependent methyltransferase
VWRAWLKGERVLRQLRQYLPSAARVFEVGAGLGCTVKVFELAGFDASGIEPGRSFQQFSQRHLRARVQHGSLFDCQAEGSFDLVLFIHIIEHLRSPRRALQTIHRLLKPGGLLYLECPSLGVLCGEVSELFHFAHLHTFTPIPLMTLLRQCGFAVQKCFSDGVGCNHKFLLTKTEPSACPIDPAGLTQTREFLHKFQVPSHRFGLRYLAGRARRIGIYLKEYLLGKLAVRRILRLVQGSQRSAA